MTNEMGRSWNYRLKLVRRCEPQDVNPAMVLRELFDLLEDYGPTWYTQETRDRAMAALRSTTGRREFTQTSA